MKTTIDTYAHPVHGLIESPEMAAARNEQIGTRKLNKERKPVTEDFWDRETRITGGWVDKESLTDDDVREITVAQIDEKMLDLADEDENNPATTKARNDLRDLKGAVVELTRQSDQSFYGAAMTSIEKLEAEGKYDEAQVMQAAAELLLEASTYTEKHVDYGGDNIKQQQRVAIKSQISEHNVRVAQNEARQK